MKKTFQVINQMQSDGVIGKYAIGGAIGATFYLEPTSTFDIDIFISFANQTSPIVSLSPIYEYLKERGYSTEHEHIVVEGWQVQFLPADDELHRDALEHAVKADVEGVGVWVMAPEHLMAIALKTGRPKDLIRIEQFVTSNAYNPEKLSQVLARHKLEQKWQRFGSRFIKAET